MESEYPSAGFVNDLVNPKRPIEEIKAILSLPENSKLITDFISPTEDYLIFRAARAGNLPLVQFILEKNPDLVKFHKTLNGADVLQFAVVSGNLELVKFLISRGSNPSYRYFMETPILNFALRNRHFDIFKYFVQEHHMDPNTILAANGLTPVHIAMEQKSKELFDYLLSYNPELVNVGPYNLLAYASRMEDDYYLKELLKRKAPFEIMEPYNRSAFSFSAEENNYNSMELILKHAKGVKPESLQAPGVSKISHEYNALCYKWQRLYDIYLVRYYCELKQNEIEGKEILKTLSTNENLEKVYDMVRYKTAPNSALFRVPKEIFKCAMNHLYAYSPKFD